MEKIGIVGFPNVGKTTFFNILTKAGKEVAPYPFTTKGKNVGKAILFDPFIIEISEKINAKEIRNPMVEIVDVAGIIEGASKGEGLGNEFLSYIRECEVLIFILRCFENPDIPSAIPEINPLKEYEILVSELYLSDLQRIEKIESKLSKDKTKEGVEKYKKLLEIKEKIEKGERVFDDEFELLSTKERIVVLNTDGNKNYLKWLNLFPFKVYPCPIKIYEEIEEMEEKEEIEKLLKNEGNYSPQDILWEAFKKLGYIIFYTVKNEIVSGFVIKIGTKAYDAAGKVHSDIKKGFIKAEVVDIGNFLKYPSWNILREKGLLRIEGKDYIIKDRDIIEFKFS
jgi:GTP-binding protein YchF